MKILNFYNFIFFKQTYIIITVMLDSIFYYSTMQLLQIIASASTTKYTSPNSYAVGYKRNDTGKIQEKIQEKIQGFC